MSIEENRAVAGRFIEEVTGKRHMTVADEIISPNFVGRTMPPGVPPGSNGMK